jgi:hypothetical protein
MFMFFWFCKTHITQEWHLIVNTVMTALVN